MRKIVLMHVTDTRYGDRVVRVSTPLPLLPSEAGEETVTLVPWLVGEAGENETTDDEEAWVR